MLAGRAVNSPIGDLKRLELAIALANQPKLLLMDEPTAGMAPRERIELMRLTARIAREQSIGVLFTEHDMDVVFEHADRILVLNRGSLIAEGSPEEVSRQPAGARHLSRRRSGLRCASPRGSRRMKLQVADLNSFYGPAHILFDIALRSRRGRSGGTARAQRGRQIDDLPFHRWPRREPLGTDRVRRQGCLPRTDARDRARRARLRAGRAANLHGSDGRGKP